MEYFVISLSQKNEKALNNKLLKEHIDYLKDLDKKGILILGGAFTDNDSAIQVYKTTDKETAEKTLKHDPFIIQDYYKKYEIKTLLVANNETNWLQDSPQTTGNLSSN